MNDGPGGSSAPAGPPADEAGEARRPAEAGRDDEDAEPGDEEEHGPAARREPAKEYDEILIESDRAFAELTRPSRRHRTAAFFGMLGVAVLAFVTGLLLFDNVVMPRLIHGVVEVRVPDLTNLTLEQAERQLGSVGLRLSRAGERFDPAVPPGCIVSQDPPEDTPVRGRRGVAVVVSLGEEFSSVPEVFGESVRGARVLVERVGLRVAGITRAPSDEVGEGLVVASDPPAETVLPHDSPIGLLVSSGAGPQYYVMPDLLGREITGARQQLEALGFKVSTPPGAPTLGTIVMQVPAPGSRIERGDAIVLQATRRVIR
ncbi:MAG TPA: PASTA domain-containing protein [Candidatus Eisenbacteria bacterium]|jgi:serine/threonine-protein kinase